MSLLSRKLVSSSMFLVSACCSMVSIYGLFAKDILTTYDYVSGVFTIVSNLLWMGASSYDIYLTSHLKNKDRHNKENLSIKGDDQTNDIEKQLNMSDEFLPKHMPIIQQMKLKTRSLNRRHSSDNLLINKNSEFADLHIKFKHQEKVQLVQIPGVFFKKEKNESENSNDVYEESLEIKVN